MAVAASVIDCTPWQVLHAWSNVLLTLPRGKQHRKACKQHYDAR
jgi:hypothetical protein